MSTPLAKRRRLNGPAAVLNKPFKSPLRCSAGSQSSAGTQEKFASKLSTVTKQDDDMSNGNATITSTAAVTPGLSGKESGSSRTIAVDSSTKIQINQVFFFPTVFAHSKPPLRQSDTFSTGFRENSSSLGEPSNNMSPSKISNTDLQRIGRANRELEANIRAHREVIDTLRQATRLLESRKDEELVELVAKWRRVSREAAEEVFVTVKERVNRMGGVGAWKEKEAKKKEWIKEWETRGLQDGAPDEDGDNDEDEGSGIDEEEGDDGSVRLSLDAVDRARLKEMKSEYKRELREQREAVQASSPDETDEHNNSEPVLVRGNDDDAFTMDMMLQVLNIDLDVIGYDKHDQRWID